MTFVSNKNDIVCSVSK